LPPTHLVIVWPGFTSHTAEAYGSLKPENYAKRSSAAAAVRALQSGKRGDLLKTMRNSFEHPHRAQAPRYGEVKAAMEEAGLKQPMLSGSGSAVFGLARNRRHARRVKEALEPAYPWSYAVQTIRTGVKQTD
jgi:4-diphosphocytidyl-2C-methyl-D-erythritol kinase